MRYYGLGGTLALTLPSALSPVSCLLDPRYLIENEKVFGHGLDDGVLYLVVVIENRLFEPLQVFDGTRRVRQGIIGPSDHR